MREEGPAALAAPPGPAAPPPAAPRAAAFGGMRLAVAAHFVYAGQVGGAEHMLYNLLRGLWRQDVELTVLCGSADRLDTAFRAELEARPNARLLERGGGGVRFLAEQRACLSPGFEADAVLFPNYFVPPLVDRRLGRVVGVLHDLQNRHFRMNFSRRKRAWLRLAHALAVRRSDRLIVISEFVRQDALRWLGRRFEGKLAVVPNPVSWERFGPEGPPAAPDGAAAPCILSVAAHYEHKNLETLLRAFALLARRRRDVRLVLCGQDHRGLRGVAGSRGGLAELAAHLGVGDRVEVTGYLDDAALGAWFRRATMFAFPSLFEGFGMPPVEALGFGLPTLTTRRTALPEVTLGLAHHVEDPLSAGEWAERMDAILADPAGHRPAPAEVRRLRAHYAPERVARAYLEACSG